MGAEDASEIAWVAVAVGGMVAVAMGVETEAAASAEQRAARARSSPSSWQSQRDGGVDTGWCQALL